MRRLALPLLRRPHLVLPSEPRKVGVDVFLQVAGDRARLLYELLDVPPVRFAGAPAFTLELVLPVSLLEHDWRFRSLGRLDGRRLGLIFYRQLEVRLEGSDGLLGWSAGVDLECGLRGTTLQGLRGCSGNRPASLHHSLNTFQSGQGLLGKVVERGDHRIVAQLLLFVIIEAMVLLRLHVLPCVRDVPRLDPVRAVLAGETLSILVVRHPLPLEPGKFVFPGGVHAERYFFNN